MKNTVATFADMKRSGQKISMLTCYDYSTARLIDASGVNAVLVGDSLGNVVLGYPDTLPVTVEDMIRHGAAVVRGTQNALVVIDMPFMSYQINSEEALRNAGRIMKETHANAVKLEGGVTVAETIRKIVSAGIPVMGHVGMTPQSVMQYGGFKVQGKTDDAAQKIMDDALAVQDAGAFSVVLECVPAELAKEVTARLSIPTIGIGAGVGCDGQVLVYQDMVGLYGDYSPKFVRRFADVGSIMRQAFADYDKAVKQGSFPNEAESFSVSKTKQNSEIKRLY